MFFITYLQIAFAWEIVFLFKNFPASTSGKTALFRALDNDALISARRNRLFYERDPDALIRRLWNMT